MKLKRAVGWMTVALCVLTVFIGLKIAESANRRTKVTEIVHGWLADGQQY